MFQFLAEIEVESSVESPESACTQSDHYILDRVNELDSNQNLNSKKKRSRQQQQQDYHQQQDHHQQEHQQQVQPAQPKQIRLERVRETSRDFIRLTKPLTVSTYNILAILNSACVRLVFM